MTEPICSSCLSYVVFTVVVLICIGQVKLNGKDGALAVVESDGDDDDGTVEVEGDEEGLAKELFYPSKEWKTVKEGQAIPRGLHVRMNLETGLKEARLMEGEDGMKFWQQGSRRGMLNPDRKSFTREELKAALKQFKATQDDVKDKEVIDQSIKKKFRSYDDLKKDFEKMNMNIKTDTEIVQQLYAEFKRPEATVAEQERILTELEYYVHQIDNALVFSDLGGINECIKTLNSTEESLRSEAAFVIGSAAQSNPQVQVKAIEGGALQLLLRMLPNEQSMKVQNRILYCLSSLLCHFPYAQMQFLSLGGLDALKALFQKTGREKLGVKALTLVNDLITEKKHITDMKINSENANQIEKLKQYNKVHILEMVLDKGWCDLVPSLLSLTEHDSREKVLVAMTALMDACQSSFCKFEKVLKQLQSEYHKLAVEEKTEGSDDHYFGNMLKTVNNLISQIISSAPKDEL